MAEITIGNIAGISEPAAKLIDRVSDALGVCFLPYQTLRMADAEAKAALIRAQADIDVNLLQQRAAQRFIQQEIRQQKNIESITEKALPFLADTAAPEKLETDWLNNFFDKCRLTTDHDMQLLWAKVLAGEANHNGNFSRKTINILADLDKNDAELFQELVRYSWDFDEHVKEPIILNYKDNIYSKNDILFESLLHLEHLGLISFAAFRNSPLSIKVQSKSAHISYFGEYLQLKPPQTGSFGIPIGTVQFTTTGSELSKICQVSPVEGFFEYVRRYLAARGLIPGPTLEKDEKTSFRLFGIFPVIRFFTR